MSAVPAVGSLSANGLLNQVHGLIHFASKSRIVTVISGAGALASSALILKGVYELFLKLISLPETLKRIQSQQVNIIDELREEVASLKGRVEVLEEKLCPKEPPKKGHWWQRG